MEETPCEHGENMQTPHRKAREIAILGVGATRHLGSMFSAILAQLAFHLFIAIGIYKEDVKKCNKKLFWNKSPTCFYLHRTDITLYNSLEEVPTTVAEHTYDVKPGQELHCKMCNFLRKVPGRVPQSCIVQYQACCGTDAILHITSQCTTKIIFKLLF